MYLKSNRFFFIMLVVVSILLSQSSLLSKSQKKAKKDSKVEKLFTMSLEELMNVKIDTAGKTPERVGDIPASVVLITREDIETHGYRSLTEILENIPGLYGIDDYIDIGTNFGVRGFWSGVANDNTYGPVNMIGSAAGSASTKKLFARAAGNEGDFTYVFNSSFYDTYGIDEPLNKMVEDPSLLPSAYGVPMDNRTGGRLENNEKFFNFSGSFKKFSVDISYNESKKEFYFLFPAVSDGTFNHTTVMHIFAKYCTPLSDTVTFEGKFTYSQHRDSYQYDVLFEDFYGIQHLETNAWEGELNTFINAHPNLDITAGLYYRSIFNANNKYDLPSFGAPSAENNHSFLVDGDEIVTRALFTQINYTPFDSLRLVAGIRLEQSPEYGLGATHTVGDQLIFKRSAIYDRDKIEFIPRLAALYYLNDRNIFKLLYGGAINRPSFFQNTRNSLDPEREDLEPESIQTLELNYVGILSSRLTLNVSLFRNVLNKLITRVVRFDDEGNYATWSENAGKIITYGMELTQIAEPIDNFRIELSGTFQETKDKREDFKDIPVAYSPKFLGYFKASYRTEWFTLALTGNYVGAMESFWDRAKPDPDGVIRSGGRIGEKVDDYFVLGANLRLRDLFIDGLFLNIKCSNLLDEEIRYPTFTNNEWINKGTIGIRRTFLVTLGYKF
ncbi:MAG: outer membrane beta-barrel protein [Candidatus Aminicenantes bacterium]|nr:MAG: outer membrane beta-barrel protein [Candidatus Aminicenantes bacterium]